MKVIKSVNYKVEIYFNFKETTVMVNMWNYVNVILKGIKIANIFLASLLLVIL